ncbi:MAG: type II secretion system protein, partial [Bacilli bacterium]|nr:type II secretion system protein [Bacilli bacterium]
MKKLNNKGFTLTELLATLAVLSLVSTIVIYVAINVVNSAKDKSYLVTRNNVEKAAVSYLEENSDKIHFVKYDDDVEYQCVTVQNLIDLSYFDKDVLNSKISNDKTIRVSDYIYIERDSNSKTIKNSKLITDSDSDSDYSTICGNYNSRLEGDIEFKIPGGYAKEKDVSIKYCLYNVSDYKNIEYLYNYVPSDKSSFIREYDEDNCLVKNIKILSNGELTAEVKDTDIKKSTSITGIDNKAPVIKIEPNGDDTFTKSKTININISDDLSGISSDSKLEYGFSKSKSEEPGSYKEVNVSTGNVKITEGSLTGEYYLWVKPSVKDN